MPTRNLQPAVFLDRDGTLNVPVIRDGFPYPPATVAEFALLPGVVEGCHQLKAAGFKLIVATNQPDVGRGTQQQSVVEAMHAHLRMLVPVIDDIQVCYHGGEKFNQPCGCRKPQPGMLLAAAATHGLDLRRSWMVGDRWRDINCGHAAGCRTVFLESATREALRQTPDFRAVDFTTAVALILTHLQR